MNAEQSLSPQLLSCQKVSLWEWMQLTLLTYENQLFDTVQRKINPALLRRIKYFIGFEPTTTVFVYYLEKNDVATAIILAFLYPLPSTIIITLIGKSSFILPQVMQVCNVGIRAAVVALICRYHLRYQGNIYLIKVPYTFNRYCLHIPQDKYHWSVYIVTILIGSLFNSNSVYLLLLAIGVFLTYYKRQDALSEDKQQNMIDMSHLIIHSDNGRDQPAMSAASPTIQRQTLRNPPPLNQQKQIEVVLPQTYPNVAIVLLLLLFLSLWLLTAIQHYSHLLHIFIIGMLNSSMQAQAFFPSLLSEYTPSFYNMHTATYIGISYLIPGPNLKVFFFLFTDINTACLTYLAFYLPSLLISCINQGYQQFFKGNLWKEITYTIQIATNGLCFITIITLLKEEDCNFNVVCYTSIVILVLSKLYKFRALSCLALGIFLVFCRATVLYLYKGNRSYGQFICIQ